MSLRKLVWFAVCLMSVVAVSNWVVAQQIPVDRSWWPGGAAPRRPDPGLKDLLYVVASGGNTPNMSHGGIGILVFDQRRAGRWIRTTFNWWPLKRIELPKDDTPAWQRYGRVRIDGIAINAPTARLYIGSSRSTHAYDLVTEKHLWTSPYGGRIAVTPDGSKIYAPHSHVDSSWAVIDAKTGELITMVKTKSAGPHNTVASVDGTFVVMSGARSNILSVVDTATDKVIQEITAGATMRVHTLNGAGTRSYLTMVDLLGFEIADVKTGKVLHRVGVPGYASSRERQTSHGTASHGIALSPDETEVWIPDSVNGGLLHVFDNTVMPPKYKQSIKLRHEDVGWITWSLDGTLVYASTGDIIDAATKKVVGGLIDEYDRDVLSEAMVDVRFSMTSRSEGKPILAGDSFARGQVRAAN
jgi:YVTN family beta-propeller protein